MNRRRGCGGPGNFIFLTDARRDRQAGNDDGLVCLRIPIDEISLCGNAGNNIIGNQVAAVDYNSPVGNCVGAVVGLIRGDYHCGSRLRAGMEAPRIAGFFVTAAGRLGCRDGNAARLLDCHHAVSVDGGNVCVTAAPRHSTRSRASGGAQAEGIAVDHIVLLAGDGQRGLASVKDCEGGAGRKAVVAGRLALDTDRGRAYIHIVAVGHGVLVGGDHIAVVIGHGDCGFYLAPGVGEAGGGQRDGGGLHGIHADLYGDNHNVALFVVDAALHLGENRVAVPVDACGDRRGICGVVQRIEHDAAAIFRVSGIHQLLGRAVVGQVWLGGRWAQELRLALGDFKGLERQELVVAALDTLHSDLRGTYIDIVGIADVIESGIQLALHVHGHIGLLRFGVVGHRIGAPILQPDDGGDLLRVDGHIHIILCGSVFSIFIHYLIRDFVISRFGRSGNRGAVLAAIQGIHHSAIDCGASCHQRLGLAGVGQVFGLGFGSQNGGPRLDGKGRTAIDGVVAAEDVGDGDFCGVRTHIDIVAVTHRVLAGRNYGGAVLDYNVGLLRCAVVLKLGGREPNDRVRYRFRLDGHRQYLRGNILVVLIADDLVPDRIRACICTLGDVRTVDDTIERIHDGSVCGGTGIDQILRLAGVSQTACNFCWRGHAGGCRKNGGRRLRVVADRILVAAGQSAIVRDPHVLLVPDAGMIELAIQETQKIDGIAVQQVPCPPVDMEVSLGRAVINLVLCGYNRCDRLLFCAERPSGRVFGVAAAGQFPGRDGDRSAGLQNVHPAGLAVDRDHAIRAAGFPNHGARSGAAHCTESKGIAVLELAGLTYDGQRALSRRKDGKCCGGGPGDVVVAVCLAGDRNHVGSGLDPIRSTVIDGVLRRRNHPAIGVLHGD